MQTANQFFHDKVNGYSPNVGLIQHSNNQFLSEASKQLEKHLDSDGNYQDLSRLLNSSSSCKSVLMERFTIAWCYLEMMPLQFE